MDDIAYTADCTSEHTVRRLRTDNWTTAQDQLAEEVPVAFEYNGISHAVMMATPADLEEFALGFSVSEGIVSSASEIYDIDTDHGEDGITLRIRLSNAAFSMLKERRRTLAGRTGCGLCGTESLAQVLRQMPSIQGAPHLPPAGIHRALAGLKASQPLHNATGGMHAAAWCSSQGELVEVMEDVGRHNALDKLIGVMIQSKADMQDGFALITSRASVEMVQKAATARMSALVAVSAPTALAVRVAEQCGLTLIAFARGDECVGYANAQHIASE